MRIRGSISWMALLALVAFGAAAQAGPRALHDDARRPWPPPPNTLPAPPHPVPAVLVDAALNLPATRVALAQMEANGYTRTPDDDAAQARDGRSFVTLAFTDPANPEQAPLVLVATDASGSTSRTWVAGGVFRLDPATLQVSLADDVAEANQFIVPASSQGSTMPRGAAPAGAGPRALREWVGCSLVGCGTAFVGCTRLGGLLLVPPQAQAGCVIAGCAILSFICLW